MLHFEMASRHRIHPGCLIAENPVPGSNAAS
jgi:hypothetical protein